MIELYFLLYRVPKMMSDAARKRNRSVLAWSLLGDVVWLVAQFGVALAFGLVYALFAVLLNLPPIAMPVGFRALAYVLSLAGAILSVRLLRNYILREHSYPLPPPPPAFEQ